MRSAAKYKGIYFCFLFILFTCDLSHAGPAGKVKKHIYYSPADNFQAPVPEGLGMKWDDGYKREDNFGFVSFHDDFGQNNGILYSRVPAEILLKADTDQAKRRLLQDWLETFMMPNWSSTVSPDSKLLHGASGTFEGMPAVFALASLPGGSAMLITRHGETHRGNSRRGLVLFLKGPWLYMLTIETLFGSEMAPDAAPTDPGEKWMSFVEEEKGFYRSISFNQ